jgi:hypothetical protein
MFFIGGEDEPGARFFNSFPWISFPYSLQTKGPAIYDLAIHGKRG